MRPAILDPLFASVSTLAGVGPKLADLLAKLLSRESADDTRVIATGGLAELIAAETDCIDHINPNLTLDGLYAVWREAHSLPPITLDSASEREMVSSQ